jgi:cysteine desulfurase/selenocysteine lyase
VAATEAYHEARLRVARFVGVRDADCLLFVRGTTEGMNLVAGSWGRANVGAGRRGRGARRWTTMRPSSPGSSWRASAGATFRIAELTADGRVDLDHLASLVNARTRAVAFPHVSNALGTVNPVRAIAALVRQRSDAVLVCDGAQGVPHLPVDFDALDVDFYAFSGHKVGGPMGIGAVLGRRALLEAMPPWQFGGDMISVVGDQATTWNALPHKFEAGTPNVADAVGLGAACDYLAGLGLDDVLAHERALVRRAEAGLRALEGITIHGPDAGQRSGVVSFAVAGVHPHDLATILDERGVCIPGRAPLRAAADAAARGARDGAGVVLGVQRRRRRGRAGRGGARRPAPVRGLSGRPAMATTDGKTEASWRRSIRS